jgi:hypothetical protein
MADYIIFGVTILLSLIAFFAVIVIKGMLSAIKDLQTAHIQMIRDLGNCVKHDDMRDLLREIKDNQKEMFTTLFDKLDILRDDLHKKVDRTEFSDTGSFKGTR